MATIFNIATSTAATLTGYQALPFIPGSLLHKPTHPKAKAFDDGEFSEKATDSITGVPLRKYKGGVYYFMPASLEHDGTVWEFDDVVVSVSGKKTIIQTPLAGRQGSVKELISIDDYEIKLVAIVSGDDYPEQELQNIVKLYEINENLVMKCAVTNYFLKAEDRVVIKSIEFPPLEGNEHLQPVVINLESDQNFELEL